MSTREKPSDPKPYYEAHVFCCTNRRPAGHPRGCCAEKGGEALRDHMKSSAKDLGLKNVRTNNAGCLDRCELGPTVVIYPQAIWYGGVKLADVPRIIDETVIGGKILDDLLIPPEKLNQAKE